MKPSLSGALALILALAGTTLAADWPSFRGPNHDNVSAESGWRTDWNVNPPKVLWQAATGYRHGCPVIADGRVFVHGDDYTAPARGVETHQTLFAFDADTGRELWKDVSVVTATNTQPITYSPTVDGNRVYFYTSMAVLKCLDAATGEPVWTQDLKKVLRCDRDVSYGYRCSPVVWQDRVIVTTRVSWPGDETQNRKPNLAAFDKMTGRLLWLSEQPSVKQDNYKNWGSHWHTPTAAVIHGREMILYNTGFSCVGIDPKDGKTIWEYKVPADEAVLKNKPEPGVCAVSPVVAADLVVFNFWSGHVGGHTYAVRIKPDLSVERVWMSDDLVGWKYVCTTAYEGAVFGSSQVGVHGMGAFTCLDLATDKKTWSQDKIGCGFTIVDGKLLIWDGTRVHLAEATAQGYHELGVSPDLPTTPEAPPPNHNNVARASQMIPPILSNGRLYCRSDSGELFCLDVRK